MRKIFIVLLLSLFVVVPAGAITSEELLEAENTLHQIRLKTDEMLRYVQIAYEGDVEGITLTTEQKQDLKDNYSSAKTELEALVDSLP